MTARKFGAGRGSDTEGAAARNSRPTTRNAASTREVVGEGPLYEPMLQNARDLVPVWVPWGVENSDNWWGASPFGVVRQEDGTHRLHVETYGWEKRGLGHNAPIDLNQLRASAISLLVYCAAEEARDV